MRRILHAILLVASSYLPITTILRASCPCDIDCDVGRFWASTTGYYEFDKDVAILEVCTDNPRGFSCDVVDDASWEVWTAGVANCSGSDWLGPGTKSPGATLKHTNSGTYHVECWCGSN